MTGLKRARRTLRRAPPFLDFDALPTEAVHPHAAQLHTQSTPAIVALLVHEEARSVAAAAAAQQAIARGVDLIVCALQHGGRLIYVGAGTSGRLGALDAAELPPTFGLPPDRAIAVMAGGHQAIIRAVEGAEDRPATLQQAFTRLGVNRRDVICAIAASGVTPFTRAALDLGRRLGAATLFVTAAPSVARTLTASVDVIVPLDVGPEVLAGSTRLKAATATKLVLSTMSTAAMIRLGRVWRGRMIDLRATNTKLRRRAERMISELASVTPARAATLLQASNGHVKPALAAALLDTDIATAARALADADGDLDRLLGAARRTGRASTIRRQKKTPH